MVSILLWNVGVCFGCSEEHQVGDTRKAEGFLTRSGLEAAQDTVSMVRGTRQLGNKQKPTVGVDKGKKQTKDQEMETQGTEHGVCGVGQGAGVGWGCTKGAWGGCCPVCAGEELSPTPGPRSHHSNGEGEFGRFHANTNLLGLAVDGHRWDAGVS